MLLIYQKTNQKGLKRVSWLSEGYTKTRLCETLQASATSNVKGFIKPPYSISRATPIDSDRCHLPTVFAYDSITVSSAWELTSVSMRYSQGDGVNTSLSRLMYCTHD